ncbi:MAG: sodium:proton antiporter [Oscillospiraceae bacterium]|nr:sodium:proton antiporter [Oscillospiraceae bacterium]
MSLWMHRYLIVILSVLGVLVLFSLLYAVLGKRFTDKIVAANMLGTLGVNVIVILAVLLGTDYILDIGLVFALLSFLMVIVLCRFLQNHVLDKREKAAAPPTGDEEVRQ